MGAADKHRDGNLSDSQFAQSMPGDGMIQGKAFHRFGENFPSLIAGEKFGRFVFKCGHHFAGVMVSHPTFERDTGAGTIIRHRLHQCSGVDCHIC